MTYVLISIALTFGFIFAKLDTLSKRDKMLLNEIKALQDIKDKYSMIKPEYVEQMCKDEYEINTNEDI